MHIDNKKMLFLPPKELQMQSFEIAHNANNISLHKCLLLPKYGGATPSVLAVLIFKISQWDNIDCAKTVIHCRTVRQAETTGPTFKG